MAPKPPITRASLAFRCGKRSKSRKSMVSISFRKILNMIPCLTLVFIMCEKGLKPSQLFFGDLHTFTNQLIEIETCYRCTIL